MDIDADEMDRQIEIKLEQDGLTDNINDLVCKEYGEDMIKQDDDETQASFEIAYNESKTVQ